MGCAKVRSIVRPCPAADGGGRIPPVLGTAADDRSRTGARIHLERKMEPDGHGFSKSCAKCAAHLLDEQSDHRRIFSICAFCVICGSHLRILDTWNGHRPRSNPYDDRHIDWIVLTRTLGGALPCANPHVLFKDNSSLHQCSSVSISGLYPLFKPIPDPSCARHHGARRAPLFSITASAQALVWILIFPSTEELPRITRLAVDLTEMPAFSN